MIQNPKIFVMIIDQTYARTSVILAVFGHLWLKIGRIWLFGLRAINPRESVLAY